MRFILYMLILGVLGCSPRVLPDQAELFKSKHPDLSGRYTRLAPASIELLDLKDHELNSLIKGLLDGVEQRADSPDELMEYVQDMRQLMETGALTEGESPQSPLERLLKQDRLYFYKYEEPGFVADGLLVLRDGDIVYRDVIGRSLMHSTDPEFQFDEIDKL